MSRPEIVVDVSHPAPGHPPVSAAALENAIRAVLLREGRTDAEISLTLLDDAEITAVNSMHLAHAGPTDVISFVLPGPGTLLVGDIYLGLDQILRQAAELGVSPREELLRVAVHGVLHLLGYDHPAGEERYESVMFKRQEELLAALDF